MGRGWILIGSISTVPVARTTNVRSWDRKTLVSLFMKTYVSTCTCWLEQAGGIGRPSRCFGVSTTSPSLFGEQVQVAKRTRKNRHVLVPRTRDSSSYISHPSAKAIISNLNESTTDTLYRARIFKIDEDEERHDRFHGLIWFL
jgi:hypothetical protein